MGFNPLIGHEIYLVSDDLTRFLKLNRKYQTILLIGRYDSMKIFFQERDLKLLLSWWEGCSRMGRGLTRGARPCFGGSGETGQVTERKANVLVFQHYFKL